MSNLGNILAFLALVLVVVFAAIGKLSMVLAILIGMLALAVLLKPLPQNGA